MLWEMLYKRLSLRGVVLFLAGSAVFAAFWSIVIFGILGFGTEVEAPEECRQIEAASVEKAKSNHDLGINEEFYEGRTRDVFVCPKDGLLYFALVYVPFMLIWAPLCQYLWPKKSSDTQEDGDGGDNRS